MAHPSLRLRNSKTATTTPNCSRKDKRWRNMYVFTQRDKSFGFFRYSALRWRFGGVQQQRRRDCGVIISIASVSLSERQHGLFVKVSWYGKYRSRRLQSNSLSDARASRWMMTDASQSPNGTTWRSHVCATRKSSGFWSLHSPSLHLDGGGICEMELEDVNIQEQKRNNGMPNIRDRA